VAAALEEAFPGIEVKLIPGSGGVFDVVADGVLVFSKKAVGRHADPEEIVAAIRARGG
jgi:selenoprotein W-related protein